MNLYNSAPEIFKQLCEEKKAKAVDWTAMKQEYLNKLWFAIIESTGGGAQANENSEHLEERMLHYIELFFVEEHTKSIKERDTSEIESDYSIRVSGK